MRTGGLCPDRAAVSVCGLSLPAARRPACRGRRRRGGRRRQRGHDGVTAGTAQPEPYAPQCLARPRCQPNHAACTTPSCTMILYVPSHAAASLLFAVPNPLPCCWDTGTAAASCLYSYGHNQHPAAAAASMSHKANPRLPARPASCPHMWPKLQLRVRLCLYIACWDINTAGQFLHAAAVCPTLLFHRHRVAHLRRRCKAVLAAGCSLRAFIHRALRGTPAHYAMH